MNKDIIKKNIKEIFPYVVTIIIVLLFKEFLFAPIRVNGSSMYSTLHDKDIMILNKIDYRINNINRFDIVVIKTKDEYLIKRIIGLPGETVEMKDNKLYINGKFIKQDFKYKSTEDFKVKVNDNYYFVLGDNRTNSLDSRYFGAFNRKNILGKANYVLFPFNRFGNKN